MKALKIVEANIEVIEAALESVNGKARSHTYVSFVEVKQLADRAEREVVKLVGGKTHAVGAVFASVSGDAVANSYKQPRRATRIVIERKGAGWYVVSVSSVDIWNEGGGSTLRLTAAQDERAVATLRKGYSVIPAE